MKRFNLILVFPLLVVTGCSNGSSGEKVDPDVAKDSYTIVWKNYDGSTLETDNNVKKGDIPTYNGTTPTRPNDSVYTYTWSGWEPKVAPATSNQTYTATYSSEKIKTEYVINFDLNGGTSASYSGSKTVEQFSKDIFFFDCIKTGWNFRGWSFNNVKIFDENGTQLANPTMSKTMTFVAVYSQTAKMTIVSNLEGAGNVIGEGEYPYNTYVDVSAYANRGYKFVGWYYQETLLSNTSDYKYMMWDEDVILEARFKLDSYLLNIHTNNEDNGLVLLRSPLNNNYLPQYQEYRDYQTTVTIAAYSKNSIRFLGWYDKENVLVGTNAVYSFTMPYCDYTLEAKWNYFSITYNLNGGVNSSSNPISYTIDSNNITLYNPTKAGYDFLGWQYKGQYVTEINTSWIENVELNAIWKAHSYSINYKLNGGVNSSSNPSKYTIESNTIVLSDPSRTGYDFAGWYRTSTFSEQVTQIVHGSTGDVTLYAKWILITYSITYNLDGGTNAETNPSTYTVESSFKFADPTKYGYTFLGWFDNSGKQIKSIDAGTTGPLILTARWNDGNVCRVTLDTKGGTVPEEYVFIRYNSEYTLPIPTKLGYSFDGWYLDHTNTRISDSGVWSYAGSILLEAHWTIVCYAINYNLNGGINAETNPKTYTVEYNLTFDPPTKAGYTFLGWYSGDILITGITKGSTGDINIEARWSASLNNLSVTSNDVSKGKVSIISGAGYTGETITVTAKPIGNCIFYGWYNSLRKVSSELTYSFTMPTNDYSLVARFITQSEKDEEEIARKYGTKPVISDDGETMTYGLYPQTVVDDTSLISMLNTLTVPESNGWYVYKGSYYAKTIFRERFSSCYRFVSNNSEAEVGETYWFKCEPIVWKVLSYNNGEFRVVSNILLDAHCYNSVIETVTIDGETLNPSHYKCSEIRSWLNNDFYNSAFSLDNSYIQDTTFEDVGITDKVFLLDYKDYTNAEYGFSKRGDGYLGYDEKSRYCKVTDWVVANNAFFTYGSSGKPSDPHFGNGDYWMRSYNSDFCMVRYLNTYGSFSNGYIDSNKSVRPGLVIHINNLWCGI